jgi:isoleucyl-tRNA synthetase
MPIDENGVFTDIITDFKGMYIKDADKEVRKYLRNSGMNSIIS